MKIKDKINRKIYRDTLKAASKYFQNRENFERAEELNEELKTFDRIRKKNKKRSEE